MFIGDVLFSRAVHATPAEHPRPLEVPPPRAAGTQPVTPIQGRNASFGGIAVGGGAPPPPTASTPPSAAKTVGERADPPGRGPAPRGGTLAGYQS